MNYNYLMDTIDGSTGCELNTDYSGSLYNGRIKNDLNTNTEFKPISKYSELDTNVDDKKLGFSEKLKVLLKNGGNKNELTDPYAFNEIGELCSGPNKALNDSEEFEKILQTQKSIMVSRPSRPDNDSSIDGKDCNGEANINKNVKLTKIAVPMYMSNSVGNGTKLGAQDNKFKMGNLKNGRTLPSVQLSSNNKPLLNKLVGKSKLQAVRPTTVNNTLKVNKTLSGKPFSFRQSQLKQKTEKKLDSKHRNFPKGKLLLNQLQKTGLLNRSGAQTARKNLPKGPFFGMGKNNQKDSNVPVNSNLNNKVLGKKSLLEESLLGLKNGVEKDVNGMTSKLKLAEKSFKNEHLKLVPEAVTSVVSSPPKSRTESLDQGKHESLERIWNIRNKLKGLKRDHHHFGLTLNDGEFDENSASECLLFQNYWFSVCNDFDSVSNNDRKRDTKLSQLKVELRHKIKQLQWRYKNEYRDKVVELLVDSARKQPNLTAFLIRLENSKFNNNKKNSRVKPFNLMKPILCMYTDESGKKCEERAMPCVKFCQQHITCSNNQLLFTACSAVRSDNTTCRAAVLNQDRENPLCLQHKRLENMSEMPKNLSNSKPMSRPSQPRKRSRSSTGSSSRSGRSRKRKRSAQKDKKDSLSETLSPRSTLNHSCSSFVFDKQNEVASESFNGQNALIKINPQVISKCDIDESQEVEVGEEVLAIAADLPLELASQATKLLEEHDFTNVLNHIPPEAFNDLFTEDKEEYEPTPQETEELERALEAVDKDVKSLEKLSQSHGILDTLLDEQTIAQTLAQLPEVTANLEVPQTLVPVFYQNGFSNINQLEQTLHDVDKSLTQTVLLNQGTEGLSNHFVNSITIPNHADLLQS